MIEGEWHLEGDSVSGWAKSAGAPLWLELLADGETLGICRADLPEPDGCGFYMPLPAALLEGGETIEVRVANTESRIGESIRLESAPSEAALTGELLVDRGLTISGWVLDPARSDEKLQINAFCDDKKVALTVAGERRYRPREANGHGFSIELPQSLADGQNHVIELKDDKGRAIPGSPFRICCLPENSAKWLKAQKKPDKPLLDLVACLFENMEERLPGCIGGSGYEGWKKAFPVTAPPGRQKADICILGDPGSVSNLIKNQQGIDLRCKSDKPEFYFLPGASVKLHPLALAQMLANIRERGAGLIYADDESGNGEPRFKPAWDREAFFAADYLGPILVTASAVKEAGVTASDSKEEARFKIIMGAQKKRLHLPQTLSVYNEQESFLRNGLINAWLNENCQGAEMKDDRLIYPLSRKPRISIIIPTRDQGELLRKCLASIRETDWPDYEILIIDNGSSEDDALTVLRTAESEANVCILRRPGVFNYAQLNNDAALAASGEFVCFLNNDTEALGPEWLAELARMMLLEGAGCAGAKLLWPNRLVQHAGVVVGVHKLAAHAGNKWLDDEPGYMGRNLFAQQYSAVTAACLLTPRKLFLEAGGFDARRFPVAFNDVDYCLRLREQGRQIYWTPHSRLMHHESASRGRDVKASAKARSEREMDLFRMKWGHYEDPFYNPNLPLSAASEPFAGLAFPPRARRAR